MTLKQQTLSRSEEARKALRSIERSIAWGLRHAETEGNLMLYAALTVAKACARSLHRSLEVVATMAGDHFQSGDFQTFSGGDDKPDDEPPPPPPPPPGP